MKTTKQRRRELLSQARRYSGRNCRKRVPWISRGEGELAKTIPIVAMLIHKVCDLERRLEACGAFVVPEAEDIPEDSDEF